MTVGGGHERTSVNCPGVAGIGYFYANPTYTYGPVEGMADDFWRFQVHTNRPRATPGSSCRDAAGDFHFDDDSRQPT